MLIVTAGLPASGKSTIAEIVGNRLSIPVLSVDPIEAAILDAGIDSDQPTGLAAYLVAERLAQAQLGMGHSVIIDAVNAVEPAREQWVRLATEQGTPIRFLEVVCSDPDVHRERLRARRLAAPHSQAAHHAVEQSLDEWEPWTGPTGGVPRVTLDSMLPLGVNVDQAVAFLES
ncbi:MAG TPA: AAA family ATPase [Pseudolysinimonas sp.]|nr:AAA family ATPase [Pseudolysinimonas sp.]